MTMLNRSILFNRLLSACNIGAHQCRGSRCGSWCHEINSRWTL